MSRNPKPQAIALALSAVLAANVRARRLAIELSPRQLAARVRSTPRSIEALERGDRTAPVNMRRLAALAAALRCEPAELLAPWPAATKPG